MDSVKNRTMTVQELIENLQYLKEEYGEDTEVMFSYTYPDYWRSQVADTISEVDMKAVTYSDYHRKHKLLNEDLENYGEQVIVIS